MFSGALLGTGVGTGMGLCGSSHLEVPEPPFAPDCVSYLLLYEAQPWTVIGAWGEGVSGAKK
jgi:hypothetical protein